MLYATQCTNGFTLCASGSSTINAYERAPGTSSQVISGEMPSWYAVCAAGISLVNVPETTLNALVACNPSRSRDSFSDLPPSMPLVGCAASVSIPFSRDGVRRQDGRLRDEAVAVRLARGLGLQHRDDHERAGDGHDLGTGKRAFGLHGTSSGAIRTRCTPRRCRKPQV